MTVVERASLEDAKEMEEFRVTWERALTVWWSIAWRSTLFGFLAAFAIGFAIAFFGAILHFNERFLQRLSILAGILTGSAVGIWAVKRVLAKRFTEFRIVLLPPDWPGDRNMAD
ncbi:MAG TPA: hypothetical protein VEF34_00570 [Syntrophobacteraceae bacterium]|nr:hypothetical protein [Syntrophobacteraceae bacterium]